MPKYAKICMDPTNINLKKQICKILRKSAKNLKICKHEIHMQNMQKFSLPTLLMTHRRQQPRQGVPTMYDSHATHAMKWAQAGMLAVAGFKAGTWSDSRQKRTWSSSQSSQT